MATLKDKVMLVKDSYSKYRYQHLEEVRNLANENYQVEVFNFINKINDLRDYLFDYFKEDTKKINDFKVKIFTEYLPLTSRYHIDCSVYFYNKGVIDVNFPEKWIILSDIVKNSLRDIGPISADSISADFINREKPLVVSLDNKDINSILIDNLLCSDLATELKHLLLDLDLNNNENTVRKKNKI